ncbi:MAG: hypothetical protein H6922_02010 [Pseudomonadaceae bacterium]|nr:hypothetical protein [Pseudomonadaceae bacterium]
MKQQKPYPSNKAEAMALFKQTLLVAAASVTALVAAHSCKVQREMKQIEGIMCEEADRQGKMCPFRKELEKIREGQGLAE